MELTSKRSERVRTRYEAQKAWLKRSSLWIMHGTLYKEPVRSVGQPMPSLRVLRENYEQQHSVIINTLQLRATLRAGSVTSFGSYGLAFVTSDGGALCFECVREEYRNVSDAIRSKRNDGWRVQGVICEAQTDEGCTCDHCNAVIWDEKQ
jgi:hypothetical protein